MRRFARITAVIFMLLGILVVLIGLYLAISGIFKTPAITSSLGNPVFDFSGLYLVAGIIAGSAVGLQGLFLTAVGLVLWLLANISYETERTSKYLLAIGRRISQPKQ
jgi:predicted ferric reductase